MCDIALGAGFCGTADSTFYFLVLEPLLAWMIVGIIPAVLLSKVYFKRMRRLTGEIHVLSKGAYSRMYKSTCNTVHLSAAWSEPCMLLLLLPSCKRPYGAKPSAVLIYAFSRTFVCSLVLLPDMLLHFVVFRAARGRGYICGDDCLLKVVQVAAGSELSRYFPSVPLLSAVDWKN